jgi:hypothetical protein
LNLIAGAMQATTPLPKTANKARLLELLSCTLIKAGNGNKNMIMSQQKMRTAWYIKIA